MKERIKRYWKKLINILIKPEMRILPASIAFNIILAIIPLLTIVVLIASYFDISIDMVTKLISEFMPNQVSEVINDVISGKGFDRSVGLFNIIAFFLASNGTYAIINTSNTLYKIRNKNQIKARLSSLILLLIIILLFLFLLVVPIFGENIISLMSTAKILSNYEEEAMTVFNIIKWPMTLLIIYLNIKLIYAISPSKNIQSEETTYGAAFTTIGWVIATFIFRAYLSHFARYDILYGNLSSIIILMVWIYFLSYIFVFGMAINVSKKEEEELIEAEMKTEDEKFKEEVNTKKEEIKEEKAEKKLKEKKDKSKKEDVSKKK